VNYVIDDGNFAIPVGSLSAWYHKLLQVLSDTTLICSDLVGLENLHTSRQNVNKELQKYLPQESGLVL